MPARVVVFLDYQNVYGSARRAFANLGDPYTAGQVSPPALAEHLTADSPYDRELAEVRVYRGRPESTKQPAAYGANQRQTAAWLASSPKVTVTRRTLRYPHDWPNSPAQEKGIDVALAIDFTVMAVRGEYDVGILMSSDTDLKPALEAVVGLAGANAYPRAEVASWSPKSRHASRLAIPQAKLWCHWVDEAAYNAVADARDYTQS